jgi:hypothetical protein
MGVGMKAIDITIHITYDEAKVEASDMEWAADKICEVGEIRNMGYEWDDIAITTEVTHS